MFTKLYKVLNKKILIASFGLLLVCKVQAQAYDDEGYELNRDSVWGFDFDMSELDYNKVHMDVLIKKLARIKHYNDSMMRVIKNKNIKWRSDSLVQLYDLLNGDISTSYNGYSFFVGQYHSNLGDINSGLKLAAFPTFPEMSFHLTNFLNYTWKRKRFFNEVFMVDGLGKDISKGDINVSYKFKSPINYTFGYAILDSKRFQFFPFASLGLQFSSITVSNISEKIFELKAGMFDSVLIASTVYTKGVEYKLKKQELILNYGLEMNFHLFYSKREKGFILGIRAARAQPLLSTGWQLGGVRYAQFNKVQLKDYYVDVVARFYLRLNGKRGTFDQKKNWWD
jgi:hypothetical protein